VVENKEPLDEAASFESFWIDHKVLVVRGDRENRYRLDSSQGKVWLGAVLEMTGHKPPPYTKGLHLQVTPVEISRRGSRSPVKAENRKMGVIPSVSTGAELSIFVQAANTGTCT